MSSHAKRVINPVLSAVRIEDGVLLGQSPRTAIVLRGNPADLERGLWRLRAAPGDLLPADRELLEQLDQQGATVSDRTAMAMVEDRRVGAWSLLTAHPEQALARLGASTVVIAGVGGVGSQVAAMLAASSVGTIVLVDDDIVTETNLTKSLLFTREALGKSKVSVLANILRGYGATVITREAPFVTLSALDLPGTPQAVVWGGDRDEIGTYQALSLECSERSIYLVSGGVVDYGVLVGPSSPSPTRAPREERESADLQQFNDACINPGTVISVTLAATLMANDLLLALTGAVLPPLAKRRLYVDLTSIHSEFHNV